MNKIIDRIEREAGVEGLVSVLVDRLSPADLQSLLLEVYRLRTAKLLPSDVLQQYESSRFVHPSAVLPSQLTAWEQIAISQLPHQFEPISLSPVCPLGTSSVVASVDQNWAISTSRNNEVISDSTNVLALECAVRRRDSLRTNPKSVDAVHLAASHRLVRAQKYANPKLASHFSSFALCSAGRDAGNFHFELETIGIQISFYLRAIRLFLGSDVPLFVSFTDFNQHLSEVSINSILLTPIQAELRLVECEIDNQRSRGRGYYCDFSFMIHAITGSDQRIELVDGGSVDWTQKYLSNSKERLVVSGLGVERLCQEF